jgi:hypothetical protein
MPMWRCPHCGTPQAETSRCWVCKRSSTSCGTCRHFRRSVAAQLGYCGLDRHRRPLRGDEIRACWEAAPAASGAVDPEPARPPAFVAGRRTGRAAADAGPGTATAGIAAIPRGFVPVGTAETRRERRRRRREAVAREPNAGTPAGAAAAPGTGSTAPVDPSERVGLWGDLDGGRDGASR